MMFNLQIGPLQVFAVLGRWYSITHDEWQRSCLRTAWRGKPGLRIGAAMGA